MRILGISAYYHYSAAALVVDGKPFAAAQEERFTRIKHDPAFPANAVRYCLAEAGVTLAELDAVVFYDKPFLKFERLLGNISRLRAEPASVSFLARRPVVDRKSCSMKASHRDQGHLPRLGPRAADLCRASPIHAASAFYPSPFECRDRLTLDGVGEWATARRPGDARKLTSRYLGVTFPAFVGLLYSAFTYYTGFKTTASRWWA